MSKRKGNVQPFHHRMVVLFTTTNGSTEAPEQTVKVALGKLFSVEGGSVIIEEHDAEAGDPHDL